MITLDSPLWTNRLRKSLALHWNYALKFISILPFLLQTNLGIAIITALLQNCQCRNTCCTTMRTKSKLFSFQTFDQRKVYVDCKFTPSFGKNHVGLYNKYKSPNISLKIFQYIVLSPYELLYLCMLAVTIHITNIRKDIAELITF